MNLLIACDQQLAVTTVLAYVFILMKHEMKAIKQKKKL